MNGVSHILRFEVRASTSELIVEQARSVVDGHFGPDAWGAVEVNFDTEAISLDCSSPANPNDLVIVGFRSSVTVYA